MTVVAPVVAVKDAGILRHIASYRLFNVNGSRLWLNQFARTYKNDSIMYVLHFIVDVLMYAKELL